jgi:hypothetical protein
VSFVAGTQITVGSAAVLLVPGRAGAQRAYLSNRGSAAVYLGGSSSGLTTSNGYQLGNGEFLTLTLPSGSEQIWAVASSGSHDVHVLSVVE